MNHLLGRSRSSLVERDEGCVSHSGKLLYFGQTQKICSTYIAIFQTRLTIRPIQLFISFYLSATWVGNFLWNLPRLDPNDRKRLFEPKEDFTNAKVIAFRQRLEDQRIVKFPTTEPKVALMLVCLGE